jgi:hypothetical protein
LASEYLHIGVKAAHKMLVKLTTGSIVEFKSDMEIILKGLVTKDVKNYFQYISLLSEFVNLVLKGNQTIAEQIDTTKHFLDPLKGNEIIAHTSKEELSKEFFKNEIFFEFLLSIMWDSVFPCYKKQGYFSESSATTLKECKWKGIEIPCESIFSKSITDTGICCSFNQAKADEIYVASTYTKTIQKLQQDDQLRSETQGIVPDWYRNKQVQTTKTGENMGLYVKIDSNSDSLGYFSINSDFSSQTVLVGPKGKIEMKTEETTINMTIRLLPVVNFINILQAAFEPIFFCQKNSKPNYN